MNITSQRLVFHRTGPPEDVLELEEIPCPDAGSDVLLHVVASPINPSDINFIQGVYGIRPDLPSTAGFEGVARVEESLQASGLTQGTLVIPIKSAHMWQNYVTAPANSLIPLPKDINTSQAAMLSVNPLTALRLLRDFTTLKPGDWIVQNAANSSVGRCVIQLARYFGWRTLNLVRRDDCVADLLNSGADHVLVEHATVSDEMKALLGKDGARLALNAVGGESALALAKVLATGGHHVTFGAMSKRPLTIPNGLMIFKQPHFHGFWLTRWLETAPRQTLMDDYGLLAGLMVQNELIMPVEKEYSLSAFKEALPHAEQGSRDGKILFRC
ncbi:MAG: MDR family NADPH-dependent oxidoreductase [Candidatus Methylacidiphilales bacterium]